MKPRLGLLSLYDHHAFSTRSLHSLLKKNSVETSCIFYRYFTFKMEPSSEAESNLLTGLLKDLSLDAVLIDVVPSLLSEAKKITGRVKSIFNMPVVWFGAYPTLRPAESLTSCDYIFRGEPEPGIMKFVNNFYAARDSEIPGLCSRKKRKEAEKCFPQITDNLDQLPLLDYSDNDKYYIEEGELYRGDPVYGNNNFCRFYEYTYRVLTTRNCPYACSYCLNQALRGVHQGRSSFVRRRSAESVVNELKQARDCLGAKKILFQDSCFADDPGWISRFCELYQSAVCLPFYCEIHPELMDEELIAKLCAAGLKYTMLGIQSGSQRIRTSLFKRNTSDALLLEKVKLLKKYDLGVHYEIITDNPYETYQDKLKALNFLLKLPRPLNLNVFSLNFYPDTDITKKALADGLISENEIEGDSSRGMRQFILKHPAGGKDKFLNYLYFLVSDRFCISGNTLGLRPTFPDKLIVFLSKLIFFKKYPRIFAKLIDLLRIAVRAKRNIEHSIREKKEFKFIWPFKFKWRYKHKGSPRFLQKHFLFTRILIFSSVLLLLMRIVELKKLLKILNFPPYKKRALQPRYQDWVILYTNLIMSYSPWKNVKNPCLVRSTILYYFLRRKGVGVKINFGIKKEEDILKGHSWLTLDGEPYLETGRFYRDFKVIHSCPS